jgi:hypothetical protein
LFGGTGYAFCLKISEGQGFHAAVYLKFFK